MVASRHNIIVRHPLGSTVLFLVKFDPRHFLIRKLNSKHHVNVRGAMVLGLLLSHLEHEGVERKRRKALRLQHQPQLALKEAAAALGGGLARHHSTPYVPPVGLREDVPLSEKDAALLVGHHHVRASLDEVVQRHAVDIVREEGAVAGVLASHEVESSQHSLPP
eukprot:CAMPEP_0173383508 /NCGR_PEP_ID=MMETSP1356-20130122/6096_1 /TAXON_ID=77927 ORGANISM="Hemiselmis virescens, Strain PCC157" /NCGR_SAMPLE_ID=MMETSP1356 /ASSEMBLY_ACC=CAM_ASM_000847 /LENGTH=163 /DNA_ID=CAMNT_0014338433 /DNA_START=367 /DNA_END=855 /DNA_ORIENTATION=+